MFVEAMHTLLITSRTELIPSCFALDLAGIAVKKILGVGAMHGDMIHPLTLQHAKPVKVIQL